MNDPIDIDRLREMIRNSILLTSKSVEEAIRRSLDTGEDIPLDTLSDLLSSPLKGIATLVNLVWYTRAVCRRNFPAEFVSTTIVPSLDDIDKDFAPGMFRAAFEDGNIRQSSDIIVAATIKYIGTVDWLIPVTNVVDSSVKLLQDLYRTFLNNSRNN